jgi:excinuclease UvrABC nuclease subunit
MEAFAVVWTAQARYSFSQSSIVLNAPEQSGVYALHSHETWVYIGESANIRAQLLQHLAGDNACITVYPHLNFSYERITEAVRAWRQSELIREFRPICNPWLG